MRSGTHMCSVTPCSRRSWTRSVVASTSLDASSSTSTFHTGAFAGGGCGVEDRPLDELEAAEGTLRLSSDSSAAVCEPSSVGDEVDIVRAGDRARIEVGRGRDGWVSCADGSWLSLEDDSEAARGPAELAQWDGCRLPTNTLILVRSRPQRPSRAHRSLARSLTQMMVPPPADEPGDGPCGSA